MWKGTPPVAHARQGRLQIHFSAARPAPAQRFARGEFSRQLLDRFGHLPRLLGIQAAGEIEATQVAPALPECAKPLPACFPHALLEIGDPLGQAALLFGSFLLPIRLALPLPGIGLVERLLPIPLRPARAGGPSLLALLVAPAPS